MKQALLSWSIRTNFGEGVALELNDLLEAVEVTTDPEGAMGLKHCNYGAAPGKGGFFIYPIL